MDAPAEAQVDLDVVRDNVTGLRKHAGTADLMAVVKSDAYGHGMIPVARAALAGGAGWLGVVRVAEALALRDAGLTAPVLCLMSVPGGPHEDAIRQDVDLAASSAGMVAELAAAAQRAGRPARVHLKVDTGMSRAGATVSDWPGVVAAALAAEAADQLAIVGIWSHLACADMPGHASIDAQLKAFREAIAVAAGPAAEGDEVLLFGPGDDGEPTAQDWADALNTVSYEIATRFGGRLPRSYLGVI